VRSQAWALVRLETTPTQYAYRHRQPLRAGAHGGAPRVSSAYGASHWRTSRWATVATKKKPTAPSGSFASGLGASWRSRCGAQGRDVFL